MFEGKDFFFEKKKQKTGRTTLRPCPGLTRVSTRFRIHPLMMRSRKARTVSSQTTAWIPGSSPGTAAPVFWFFFSKKNCLP